MVKEYYLGNSDCFIDVPIEQPQQNVAKRFVDIYIDNLIKKFRFYNDDRYTIEICGLGCFIEKRSDAILYFCEKLKENKFFIEVTGSEKHIGEVLVICINNSKNETYNYNYQIQNLPSIIELSSLTEIPLIGIIIMKIVAQTIVKQKVLYKAIVLDLDDTLWRGTLAEDGFEKIKERLNSDVGVPFVSFMNFIKALATELGVFVAICSRNDLEQVKHAIEELDESVFPLKNQIDCIVANYNDKSDNLQEIARRLSILPHAMMFIDDNQIVRDEVIRNLPEVFVPQWDKHSELITQLIVGCFFERNELSINSQVRRRQFEILQTERKRNDLPELLVKVFDDEGHREAMDLYAKSNQFKLSNLNSGFDEGSESLYFEMYRQDGEDLGVCSAITYRILDSGRVVILNWAISCRYFEIGLEEFILLYVLEKNEGRIQFVCQRSAMNKRVNDLIDKYYGCVIMDDCSSAPNDSSVFIEYLPDEDEQYISLLSETTNVIGGFALYDLFCSGKSKETLKNNTNLKMFKDE